MIPVILSGGSGTRLWPLSRESFPKQFLPLVGNESMLQATWRRVAPISSGAPIIVANEEHRFMVAEQLRQIECRAAAIILEPVGRNTAPAIAVAALQAQADGSDPLMLVLPSDHSIVDVEAFREAVRRATPAADEDRLVAFGIVPSGPETGYGYIRAAGGRVRPGDSVRSIDRFVEKPDLSDATAYLASGEYLWNSGMFLFRASAYLRELDRLQSKMLAACRDAFSSASRDADFVRLGRAAFSSCPSDSIDYAVMESTSNAAVLPIDVGWDDVGSWSALWNLTHKDEQGNALRGDAIAEDCRDSLAWADGRLVAMIGLDNVIVVDTPDALLVAHRDKVQNVRAIVSRLKAAGRSEPVVHRKVYRPWGSFDGIDSGDRFQVKRIVVKPGASLSMQMHHHRAEHWIVVRGTGCITKGEETVLLSENQSTYIPLGVKHRLENPGRLPLELIEVQSGSYLGEDDIVRFEDVYGRS